MNDDYQTETKKLIDRLRARDQEMAKLALVAKIALYASLLLFIIILCVGAYILLDPHFTYFEDGSYIIRGCFSLGLCAQ